MASPILQFKRGSFENLPGLRLGEPGFTTDRSDFYVGLSSSLETNKFFGSARYWTRENGTNSAEFKLVDKDGDVGVSLRAPATVSTAVTYTLPQGGGTTGHFLKLGNSGVLEWATVTDGLSFNNITVNSSTFTGISTFSGAIDANGGLNVAGGSTFDNIDVTGIGTITTADINGGNIDGTVIGASSAAAGTFTQLNYSNSSSSGISTVGSLYVGTTKVLSTEGSLVTLSGIATIDATTKSTLESILSLDPNDFTSLNVSGISTFAGALNANGNVTLGDNSSDVVTIKGTATFEQPIVGTISTATRATQVDTTTAPSGTYYPGLFVNNTGTTSASVYVDSGISYESNTDTLTLTGDLAVNGGDITSSASTFNLVNTNVTTVNFAGAATALIAGATTGITTIRNELSVGGDITVGGNDIKASDGTTTLTLATTGAVTAAQDLTVQGNLYVNGSTTQVNTTALSVEDRTIDLGIVNGATPASTTTWDLGVLFNYFSGSAKKSAVIWEHGDSRFKFASVLASDTDGTTVNTPQLTVTTFAPIEVASLWVNNTCTGSAQEVIGCIGSELNLQNIVVDAGFF